MPHLSKHENENETNEQKNKQTFTCYFYLPRERRVHLDGADVGDDVEHRRQRALHRKLDAVAPCKTQPTATERTQYKSPDRHFITDRCVRPLDTRRMSGAW